MAKALWSHDDQWSHHVRYVTEWETREDPTGELLTLADFQSIDVNSMGAFSTLGYFGVSFESFSRSMKKNWIGDNAPLFDAVAASILNDPDVYDASDIAMIVAHDITAVKNHLRTLNLTSVTSDSDMLDYVFLLTLAGSPDRASVRYVHSLTRRHGVPAVARMIVAKVPFTSIDRFIQNDIDPSLASDIALGAQFL
jgi:hypothetical protein